MGDRVMSIFRLICIGFIMGCTAIAWFILGVALQQRGGRVLERTGGEVNEVWGPEISQPHPSAFYLSSPGLAGGARKLLPPPAGKVNVQLEYEPKKRGLFWHRTYQVNFDADYIISNPTPVEQTIYVEFRLPSQEASYSEFKFVLGDGRSMQSTPKNGILTEAVTVPARGAVPLKVAYRSRGMNEWRYQFPDAARVRDFMLEMQTNFAEYSFPKGTASPTAREPETDPRLFVWNYVDVLSAPEVGMEMPKVLNAGPVAARISFFAPVSLMFYFAVLLIVGVMRGANLHPVNYFFLAAGCFAFQLLFAYLVDRVEIMWSFAIAATVSLALVCGYIRAVAGQSLFWVALAAQLFYMVLFSFSFFFDGWTGLTITIGAILTLAMLMMMTAKVKWETKFQALKFGVTKATVPPLPKTN